MRTRLSAGLLAVSAVIGLAACSSDDSRTGSAPTTAPGSTATTDVGATAAPTVTDPSGSAPATAAPTTAAPTTAAPTTAAPTTAAPTTAAPPPPPPTTVPCRRVDTIPGDVYAAGLDLRRGDCGDGIRILQEALNRNGASLTVDGRFGAATESAVRAFQTRMGGALEVTGRVDPATWTALFGSDPPPEA